MCLIVQSLVSTIIVGAGMALAGQITQVQGIALQGQINTSPIKGNPSLRHRLSPSGKQLWSTFEAPSPRLHIRWRCPNWRSLNNSLCHTQQSFVSYSILTSSILNHHLYHIQPSLTEGLKILFQVTLWVFRVLMVLCRLYSWMDLE